jgi:hypothetical protein
VARVRDRTPEFPVKVAKLEVEIGEISERDRQLAEGLEYLRLSVRKELKDNVAGKLQTHT